MAIKCLTHTREQRLLRLTRRSAAEADAKCVCPTLPARSLRSRLRSAAEAAATCDSPIRARFIIHHLSFIITKAVLFITHKYPPATGGMEKQSYELITGMQRHTTVHSIVLGENENRLTFFWTLERRIMDMLRAHPEIEVVHFNDALLGAVALRHKQYTHLRRYVTVHGLDVVFPNRIFQQRVFPLFNRYDKLIAVSRATAQACVERGIDASRVVVVPNGVSHDLATMQPDVSVHDLAARYGFDADRPYFIALGRSVRRKGFSWFAEQVMPLLPAGTQFVMVGPFAHKPSAFERFLSVLPRGLSHQIELVLGFPTDQAPLRRIVREQRDVHHLGRLRFEHMVAMLQNATAFVMPNIKVAGDMEGFGLVCLEAALAGAPVFAAGIDGITDAIVDGKNGTLLPSADAKIWAKALGQCMAQPELYKSRAASGRTWTMEQYGWDKMVAGYAEFFFTTKF